MRYTVKDCTVEAPLAKGYPSYLLVDAESYDGVQHTFKIPFEVTWSPDNVVVDIKMNPNEIYHKFTKSGEYVETPLLRGRNHENVFKQVQKDVIPDEIISYAKTKDNLIVQDLRMTGLGPVKEHRDIH